MRGNRRKNTAISIILREIKRFGTQCAKYSLHLVDKNGKKNKKTEALWISHQHGFDKFSALERCFRMIIVSSRNHRMYTNHCVYKIPFSHK